MLKKVSHWGAINWSQCALAVWGNQTENFHLMKDFGRTRVQGRTIVDTIAGSMWIGGVPGCFRQSRGNWGQGVAGLTTPTVQLKNWIHLHKNAVPGLIPVWRVWYGGGWAKNWSKMMELGELTVGSSDKQRIVVNDGWSLILLLPGSIHVCWGSRQHSAEIHCLRIIQHFFW